MPHNVPTILVADDDRSIRTVLKQALLRAKYNVELTDNATQLWEWVLAGKGDIIITDVSMPDMNVFDIIPKIKETNPDLPIIVISALSNLSTALQAEKESVFEYLPKPFDLDKLLNVIRQALTFSKKAVKESELTEQLPLVGKSAEMQNIYRIIARLVNSDLSVIISGENGTGKEAVAKALHHYGSRRNYPFIALNMTAMSENEIEATLFGVQNTEKNQTGYFEQASNGTLFFDEIGELPFTLQTRLIRILKEKNDNIKASTRIIASTCKDLFKLVQDKQFREDLYYYLNIIPIHMPPLKDRTEDIPLLIQYFLQENLSSTTFSEKAIDFLQSYHWPGNIRELQNLITRLVALYPNQQIQDDLVIKSLPQTIHSKKILETLSLSALIEDHIGRYFSENKGLPINKLYAQMMAEVEKPLIEQTLIETEGNQIKAASILGINRNTLRKKIKDFNIICKQK